MSWQTVHRIFYHHITYFFLLTNFKLIESKYLSNEIEPTFPSHAKTAPAYEIALPLTTIYIQAYTYVHRRVTTNGLSKTITVSSDLTVVFSVITA